MPKRPAIGLKAFSMSSLSRFSSLNSVRMKNVPPPCSVECWSEWMMFAPRSNRKCETAATTPGLSGQEIRRRPMSSFIAGDDVPQRGDQASATRGGGSHGSFELVGVLGALPRHVEVRAAKVAVGSGLLEDRPAQVERFDDARW